MLNRTLAAIGIAAGLTGLVGFTALTPFIPGTDDTVHRVDFGEVTTRLDPAFDATLPHVVDARLKEFRIPITHETIEIADGVTYDGWTFGGTVPGPAMRVREGDLERIELVNESPMPHSIDLHSARIPMNEAFRNLAAGESLEFEFVARDPGAYMVHCGTAPVLMHIMQGMYMAIIVDPVEGWGTRADKEFVLVQSEFYASEKPTESADAESADAESVDAESADAEAPRSPDYRAAMDASASHVVFNGKAFQYKQAPLEVEEGDLVRLFVVNAGPSLRSDFHVVGTVFDRVLPSGDPDEALSSIQTWTVPAGGGAVFETTFERGASGKGVYAFVTHAFADAEKGAVGLIKVGSPPPDQMASH